MLADPAEQPGVPAPVVPAAAGGLGEETPGVARVFGLFEDADERQLWAAAES